MRTNAFAALLVAIILCGCANPNHVRTSSLGAYLPGVREFLEGFVDSESTNEIDYFYVSPVSHLQGRDFAYAYWMTDNSIIILDLPIRKMENAMGYRWYSYKAHVDLARDVVPTGADIQGSTYLWSSDAVEETLRDCLVRGVKVIVKRNVANKALQPTATAPSVLTEP